MMGKVTYGKGREAVLNDDGTWAAEDKATEQMLNLYHSPGGLSPADGDPAYVAVNGAAKSMNGQAVLPPRRPSPPGTIH